MGLSDLFDSAKNIFDAAKTKAAQLKDAWEQQKALNESLCHASSLDKVDSVRRLLQEGANAYDDALAAVATHGKKGDYKEDTKKEIAKILIDKGAWVRNIEPFYASIFRGDAELAELLATRMGGSVLQQNWNGATALMLAAAKGYTRICNILLERRDTDVNAGGRNNALMRAIRGGHKETAELLIYKSASVSRDHLDAAKEYCPDLCDLVSNTIERQQEELRRRLDAL